MASGDKNTVSDPSHVGDEGPIIFFDGVCVLCNGFVDWVIRRDPQGKFKFASLQGSTAAALREKRPELPPALDTIVLWSEGQLGFQSSAVFAILSQLSQPWRALALLRFTPRWLRDSAYRMVAAVRYSLFGRTEICRVPSAEDRGRLLP
ncbi:MAG TPA: DCC1-like thiol-disulfide oxidoreductase family protein [Polyangiaceae bacterium]|nr:DCC1-like thiol-disulfide oxidoreductase family protein [Polyangiaceae bacterium]